MTALSSSDKNPPMKNLVHFTLISLSIGFILGCATIAKGPNYSDSKAINSKPGYATLYVFREYAEPTAWGANIQVDTKPVSTLNQNGFTWVYVKPGKKDIKAVWSGMSGQKDSFISIDTVEGKTYYVELTGISQAAGGIYPVMYFKMGSGLNQVKPESAVKRLETCCKFQEPSSTAL